ncbi:DUF2750 domain-containing protein [Vibrio sp. V27_P1S3P104]|uniref:DUF2750 domain-containing protein n=1 Tax=unclassified Vibrio TaxID=2614977 RepID=UPI0013723DEF|nr:MULTISPECIES: DUF2750 domain-containing protein [unclassified Vibrio]NAW68449.1 DUF2750 domain-containing protein [Vibrio sp. V28_P6S34P95]NAX04808.1 DUF2750 domain-containing protein [Vibrio sp. V30_P3S12P165]NAX34449.1 DUF2750 domain-containing protein [Vibrio sp. V29_P1S30P107]NAX36505.1 DUF2750 domain-containing protein [Vibrio sp. V27_P1S3P104]NAX41255.1 DUF2750 domain-containing protein [Vibrio sp. V26_P1S5P106]
MVDSLNAEQISSLNQYDSDQRMKYSLKQIIEHQQVWILTDQHGCVMLNTEDDDCVPVWPHQELAQAWATGEWADCQAQAIPLHQWRSRWTPGLSDDQLSVVVFPNDKEEGVVLFPDEFDFELNKQQKAR